jgi:UDP-N-acetylmuramate: L-alanyl-gamma-D-glutamyl-meso-diaminopimelate ligase
VYRAEHITRGERTTFLLQKDSKTLAEISTSLLGSHNVQNIVGAAALLLEKKSLTPEQFARAIQDFPGLERRLDKKTTRSSIPAFEGFGSSREKLHSAIGALKAEYPDKRLVVVFEPHSFSWRNKKMLHWFDTAFEHAGLVILYKPAELGARTHEQSTQKEMAARLSHTGIAVVAVETKEEALQAVKKETRSGDVVLLSSSGAMDGLIEDIPKWLDNEFSQ